jgi:hypothetical protein
MDSIGSPGKNKTLRFLLRRFFVDASKTTVKFGERVGFHTAK